MSLNRPTFFTIAGVGALTGIALILRVYQLGVRDFWFDESCTFYYLQNLFDWPEGSRLIEQSTNLPYYLLLRGWMAIFGDNESALRSLSVVASLLTIPFIGLASRRVGGWEAGFAAVVLAAVHPLSVYYAREARAYALWMLLLAVLLWLLVEAVRSTRKTWWVAYGAVLLLSLHLHYFTVFWAVASAASVLLSAERAMALRRWLITSGIALALFVPYFLMAVWPAARSGGSAWIADGGSPWLAILRTLWAFLPAGDYPGHLRGLSLASGDTFSPWPGWMDGAAEVLSVLLIVMLCVSLLGKSKEPAREASVCRGDSVPQLALWAVVLVSLALPVLYSVLVKPTYLAGRYDLVAWPAFVVGLGCLLGEMWRRVGRGLALGVIILSACCSLVADARMLNPPVAASPNQLRALRTAQLAGAEDVVIALSYDRWALHYDLHRAGFVGEVRSFPTWLDRQVGWVDTPADLAAFEAGRVRDDAVTLIGDIKETFNTGTRMWLLADSLDLKNVGARSAIHAELIAAIAEAGWMLQGVDEEYLIYRIVGQ